MTQEVRRLRLRSKTFTLVEQLSVILIVAVLATVIAIKAKGRIDTAKGEQTVGNMAQIAEKCVQYYQSNGSWPATIEVLKPAYLPGGFIQCLSTGCAKALMIADIYKKGVSLVSSNQ